MEEHNKREVTLSQRTLLLLAAGALLLLAAGLALGLGWQRWFGPAEPEPAAAFSPQLDPSAQQWTGEQLPDKSEKKEAVGIKIPGYPSISLPADTTDVTVALLNPEGNPCYFTFELALNDPEEVLYTSGMVAPGQVISQISLARPLAAGEYDATIRITTASLEDGSAMNGANVVTRLIVK